MTGLKQEELNSALWASADEMRKTMSADVYKDYLLGLSTRVFPTIFFMKLWICWKTVSRRI